MKAMQAEIESLIEKRAFDLVPLPKGKKKLLVVAGRTKLEPSTVSLISAKLD